MLRYLHVCDFFVNITKMRTLHNCREYRILQQIVKSAAYGIIICRHMGIDCNNMQITIAFENGSRHGGIPPIFWSRATLCDQGLRNAVTSDIQEVSQSVVKIERLFHNSTETFP